MIYYLFIMSLRICKITTYFTKRKIFRQKTSPILCDIKK